MESVLLHAACEECILWTSGKEIGMLDPSIKIHTKYDGHIIYFYFIVNGQQSVCIIVHCIVQITSLHGLNKNSSHCHSSKGSTSSAFTQLAPLRLVYFFILTACKSLRNPLIKRCDMTRYDFRWLSTNATQTLGLNK